MSSLRCCAVLFLSILYLAAAFPESYGNSRTDSRLDHRLHKITNMYAFEGFVYTLTKCPSWNTMLRDFIHMREKGARNVITFEYCGDGADPAYYGGAYQVLNNVPREVFLTLDVEVIQAAGLAGLNIIPLAWTLLIGNETLATTAVPKIKAVIQAVIENPGPVLAVALGDEPLYDNDFGSANSVASYIRQMKHDFAVVGLSDLPVSTSELAYGWQISGNISAMVDAVDFFMINNFPYFAFNAKSGGNNTSWTDFVNDMNYYAGIAQGKPLLVTQTGWPSTEEQYSPNSPDIVVSVESEQAYWNLLDGHCGNFFKARNIGWMWRSWDDDIKGWGVLYENRTVKWDFGARKFC